MNIGIQQEENISNKSLEDIIKNNRHKIIPRNHPVCVRINSIVEKLTDNISHLIPGYVTKFQVFVIDCPEPNAFVLPGGQIFVNTGILPVALNDNGLATILAHEVYSFYFSILFIIFFLI